MQVNDLHAGILSQGLKELLGNNPSEGSMAYTRCLAPDVVHALARNPEFSVEGWQVWCVADKNDDRTRTIAADRAVEIREVKGAAALLLVDAASAGAGMDGIYSAAREVTEAALFRETLRIAKVEVTRLLSARHRQFAESAISRARRHGNLLPPSPWTEFDFLCRIAAEKRHPGTYLYLLGLWPVKSSEETPSSESLDDSGAFVDHLLGVSVSGQPPGKRIDSLALRPLTREKRMDLERFLHWATSRPLLEALAGLADKKHLWVNELHREVNSQSIQEIQLSPWRTSTGRVVKWSGLTSEVTEEPPVLVINPEPEKGGDYRNLEVRWKSRPQNLEKDAVKYIVEVLADTGEELSFQEVSHSARANERAQFSSDDFAILSEDAFISAKAIVSVVGELIPQQETEEFIIRVGQPPTHLEVGGSKPMRTLSEGLIELSERETVSEFSSFMQASSIGGSFAQDTKGNVLLRIPQLRKRFGVHRAALIREVEEQWVNRNGQVGRWRVKVHTSGTRAGKPTFIPLDIPGTPESREPWDRIKSASRKMAERFAKVGGVGQVYDQRAKGQVTTVREYLLAWSNLYEGISNPHWALANTVEVQTLSGKTIGLIVLPQHPLRVAWHSSYDNLVLHAAFDLGMEPSDIRKEFSALDGTMFPAMLPGLDAGASFVFADMLGFHAVGMVSDRDSEPKAAVSLLARAMGESETPEATQTVGEQSALVLGKEIRKYLDFHYVPSLLRVHALRAGDGLTVAKALGEVQKSVREGVESQDEAVSEHPYADLAFLLELYPSPEQRAVTGRHIAEAKEKRRSGAGGLSADDLWMLDSVSRPGGISLPKLRWARKDESNPSTVAHIAAAFDTFESRVVAVSEVRFRRPLYAFGLLSFFERQYMGSPYPTWRSIVPPSPEGEKHPTERGHTERLSRLQEAIQKLVAQNCEPRASWPILQTEVLPDKRESLIRLHELCDWVITLDRNAGVEYFDSPRVNKEIYESFVIDCVPERDDLGCLQLITSTSNLDEVHDLLDGSLSQMGISHSDRNAKYLMGHLKALSGRLAIRLTGQKGVVARELVALALCHVNSCLSSGSSLCWVSLEQGVLIPVDDIQDLLPGSRAQSDNAAGDLRPDLIYLTVAPRTGLSFCFIEVKYRWHLRSVRQPAFLSRVKAQVDSLRTKWEEWYGNVVIPGPVRALRRAKLARILRFYTDKAHRHYLSDTKYENLIREIDRMIERGGDYIFADMSAGHRGWIFCPEYLGAEPVKVSPEDWDMEIYLFGPGRLTDVDYRNFIPSHLRQEEPVQRDTSTQTPISEQEDDGYNARNAQDTTRGQEKDVEVNSGIQVVSEPVISIGVDAMTGKKTNWSLTVRGNPHLLVSGLPGMGKTTLLLHLCKQMEAARVWPIIFSYHQDIDSGLEQLGDSVRFIDADSLGFNPLQVHDRTSPLAYLDVAGAVRDIFVAIYPDLGDLQSEQIRAAIRSSFLELGWGQQDVDRSNLPEPDFKRFVEILQNGQKVSAGLLSRLEELSDYGFFDIRGVQGDLWKSEQAIIIRVHTTQNENLQRAFTSLVFYGLYKDMFRRGIQDRVTHAVVFDEAHRAAGLKLIPTMAKECRKYGISLVIASQEAKDFHSSLFAAIANYIVLRLTDADAKALVRNVTGSQQERILVDKVKQLERFKALYFQEGSSRPTLIRLLP